MTQGTILQNKDRQSFMEDQKDEKGKFIHRTLERKEKKPREKIPGVNQPQIEEDVQVRGSGSGGVSSKTIGFSKSASSGTGTESLTGFGFQPTGYVIEAWPDSGSSNTNRSHSSYITGQGLKGYYIDGNLRNLSSRVICVYESGNTRANHSAFLSDGIEVDFISDGVDINYLVTAFK